MNNYVLSCCSTADLSKEHFERRNINCIPFHFYVNNEHYYDDLGQSMDLKKFYDIMRNGADVKTSQINSSEVIENFTPILESGKDILHISLSSGISGAYNSAVMAKEELEKKFPDRKIYVVDSLAASSGFGLIMDKLADMRDENLTIEELCNWVENNKLKLNHWFTPTDLKYLVKGGRVSKVSGFFGGLLKICPILNVDKNGKLVPVLKIRSKQKALVELYEIMKKYAENGLNYTEKCYISHSDCYNDAKILSDMIQENFKNIKEPVLINSIGTTIGSHAGPGTVALFFWGQER